jgi:hypothetical protein
MTDHHSEYLAKAIAALTPEGHQRVDELMEQLAEAGGSHEALPGSPRLEKPRPASDGRRAWSISTPDPRSPRRTRTS